MKITIISILFFISISVFSQTVFVPNSGNINTTPNGHTLLKFNRSGNNLYISFDNYYTGDNSEYPTNYPGTEYYVSNSGSDSNNGLTKATPFATISKINALSTAGEFGEGDAILFQSTGGWEETLTISNSGTATNPLTIGAYGINTSKPKIYGSKVITGWTQRKAGIPIYVTKYSTADITQLFLNGAKMVVARYPNTGYHTITSEITTDIRIAASAMTNEATNYYRYAKVLTRQKPFYSDIREVTASNGDTITLNAVATDIQTGEGIVLMNKFEFLDAPGEWYYNTTTDSLYFWKPDSTAVTDTDVRGSTITDGVQITSKNYVTVQDLNILQQKVSGINMGGLCTNIKILNNTISGQESYGIEAEFGGTGSKKLEYSGNTISDISGAGMFVYRNDTTIVRDNVISRIGLFEHLGNLGTTQIDAGYGMFINGRGNLIEYNRVDSVGYHGILWKSYEVASVYYNGPSTVQYNYVKDATLFKSDGGGIYASGGTAAGSVVRYNIVDGCLGLKDGSTDTRNFGNGIYLDEPASSHTVEYNTVLRCTDSGINIHDGTTHTIRYNTIYDCRQSFGINDTVNSSPSSITYNLSITNARIDTPMFDPRQLHVSYYNDYNMDTWNYNTYVNGYASDLVFKRIVVGPPYTYYYALADWRTFTGGEAASTYLGTDLISGESQRVVYNDTKSAKTFNLNGATAKDENGTSITTGFTLQPFTSKYVRGTDLDNIE